MPAFSTAALLFADSTAEQPQGPNLLWMLPILFVMMWVMGGPRRRAEKEHRARMAALKTGDEVVAAGGIHGLVTNVSDRVVTLKIADNVKIKVEKGSVVSVVKKSDEPEPAAAIATREVKDAKEVKEVTSAS